MKLRSEFGNLKLSSPVLVGAGPGTDNFDSIRRAEDAGAGGIYTKSIGPHKNTALGPHDRRRCKWVPQYGMILKSTYLREILSIEYGVELVRKAKESCEFPIIASVFYPSMENDEDIENWLTLFRELEKAKADAIQIDFFYINLRKLSNDKIQFLIQAIMFLIQSVQIPLFPKLNLSIDQDLVRQICKIKNLKGLVYYDTIRSEPYIDIFDRGRPVFDGQLFLNGHSRNVIAGKPLLHFTLSMTQQLRRITSVPLSAGGGLSNYKDIIRCIMLGANCVHLTSILMRRGFRYIKKLNQQICDFLENQGYESLKEIVGISYGQQKDHDIFQVEEKPFIDKVIRFDKERCIQCGICRELSVCKSFLTYPYDFKNNCDGCSLCVTLCPGNALVLEPLNT